MLKRGLLGFLFVIVVIHGVTIIALERKGEVGSSKKPIVLKDDLHKPAARARARPTYTIISSQEGSNNHEPIDWSILICTLPQRRETFKRLYGVLMQQIKELGLQDRIEILSFEDDGRYSIGFKRNMLLQASRGEYVNFLDDDDMVHEKYVGMIYEKLRYKPDCISLTGIQTTNGENPIVFYQSVIYDTGFECGDIRCLPPHHTNTMKRSIAIQFTFPHISSGEDTEWAMQLAKSKLLQNEIVIEEPYYFYLYTTDKTNMPSPRGQR